MARSKGDLMADPMVFWRACLRARKMVPVMV